MADPHVAALLGEKPPLHGFEKLHVNGSRNRRTDTGTLAWQAADRDAHPAGAIPNGADDARAVDTQHAEIGKR